MRQRHHRMREPVLAFIGVLLFLGLWQVIGMEDWAGPTWPALPAVAEFLFDPAQRPLFLRAATATFAMAGLGYGIGTAAGLSVAALAHLVTPLRPGLDRFASLLHAIPSIALAPLFIVLLSRELTGAAIAAIGVFFVVYVAATSGLEASPAAQRDLFRVFGASRLTRFMGLDIPSAIPALASGLKYAVPIAFIGAILGEWFGSARGLGLLIVSAMQNFQIPLLWSAVIITSVTSLAVYGAVSVLERIALERYK